jgi:hypothetical protein
MVYSNTSYPVYLIRSTHTPQRRYVASTALLSIFCVLLFVLLMLAVTLGTVGIITKNSEVCIICIKPTLSM